MSTPVYPSVCSKRCLWYPQSLLLSVGRDPRVPVDSSTLSEGWRRTNQTQVGWEKSGPDTILILWKINDSWERGYYYRIDSSVLTNLLALVQCELKKSNYYVIHHRSQPDDSHERLPRLYFVIWRRSWEPERDTFFVLNLPLQTSIREFHENKDVNCWVSLRVVQGHRQLWKSKHRML